MRPAPVILLVGVSCGVAAPAAMPVNRLVNEVRLPAPGGWHTTGADGWLTTGTCEVQFTPSSERIAKTDKALPVTVWFRNPTDKPASVRCIAGHRFNPHGRLRVTGPKGEEVLGGECLKKHAMQQILLDPGQVRGFACEAFSQGCYRKPAGDLTPGRYLLEFMGAKASVVVEETEETSRSKLNQAIALFRNYSLADPNHSGQSNTSSHNDCEKALYLIRESKGGDLDRIIDAVRDDESPEVRYWLICGLRGKTQDKVRDVAIHALANDASEHIRYRAAEVLGYFDDKASQQALIHAFRSVMEAYEAQNSENRPSSAIASNCCGAFRRRRLAAAAPAVIQKYDVLKTMYLSCFQDALHFLAEVDTKESVTFLAAKAKTEDDLERVACVVRSIGPTKHADVLALLAEMADRKEFRIHVAAMGSLSKFPRQAVIPIFIRHVDRADEYVAAPRITECGPSWIEFAPHNTLRKWTGEDFGKNKSKWQEWWEKQGQRTHNQSMNHDKQ